MYPCSFTHAKPSTIKRIEDYLQIPWLPNTEVTEPGIVFLTHPGWTFRNHHQVNLEESFESERNRAVKERNFESAKYAFIMAKEYWGFNWLMEQSSHKIIGISWMLGETKPANNYDNRHVEIVKSLLDRRTSSVSFLLTPHMFGDLYPKGIPGILAREKLTLKQFIEDHPLHEFGGKQFGSVARLSRRFKHANLAGAEIRACLSHSLSTLYPIFEDVDFCPELSEGNLASEKREDRIYERLETLEMTELTQDPLMQDVFKESTNLYTLMREVLSNNPYQPKGESLQECINWAKDVQQRIKSVPLEDFPVLG